MKKLVVIGLVIILVLGVVSGVHAWTNKQWFDTTFSFERAIINLPDGYVIEGKLDSWLDFENSDQIQVKIDGITYLTHILNVCLISE